jgi:hypothetical protein
MLHAFTIINRFSFTIEVSIDFSKKREIPSLREVIFEEHPLSDHPTVQVFRDGTLIIETTGHIYHMTHTPMIFGTIEYYSLSPSKEVCLHNYMNIPVIVKNTILKPNTTTLMVLHIDDEIDPYYDGKRMIVDPYTYSSGVTDIVYR